MQLLISYQPVVRRLWQCGGAAALLAVLAGCAVVPGAAGSGSGTLARGSAIALAAEAEAAGPGDALIRRALVQQLSARGFVLTADAPMTVHVGLAIRDPGVGFTSGGQAGGDGSVATGAAPVYRGNDLSLCREQAVRLSLAIYRVGADAPAFTSAAEDVVCGALTASKAALLVDTALRPMASD